MENPDDNILLATDGLLKEYRHRRVVNGVSINVRAGEIVGLLGPNGAGKTTTFNIVVGGVRPDGGTVSYHGQAITSLPMHERARLGIGYLTQEPSIFRKLTVEQNILAILETCEMDSAERAVRLKYLLDELDLSSVAKSMAYQLSGGEKRRLEITRALVTSPKLLLLDEPFSGIDPIAVYEVQKIIRRLRERGLGILITDHNVRETLKLVDRAYLIHKGEVVYDGVAEQLVNDPKAREIYLGPEFNTVEKFYTDRAAELGLKLLAGAAGLKRPIIEPTVNRPGLVLTGFTRDFAWKRVQVFGNADACYLRSLKPELRQPRYAKLLAFKIPCIVFSRNLKPDKLLLKEAERFDVPIFQTPLITTKFINLATIALDMMFAPFGTEIGSMVDILGVGVIIKGESGIGKSESVLELIERGYSLVADDATKVTLLDGHDVIGQSDELTRDHMEVRGIGIVNIAAMFGVKSITKQKRVDLVVSLKAWEDVKDVDRVGMDDEYVKILGVDIPHIVIPVRPGRNLARLIEVAAFQTKLKMSGYNPAKEFNDRLIARMNPTPAKL